LFFDKRLTVELSAGNNPYSVRTNPVLAVWQQHNFKTGTGSSDGECNLVLTLFCSVAQDEATLGSVVDLLVRFEQPVDLRQLFELS
jgi:hypothetical protein